jgi:hypothetical protein
MLTEVVTESCMETWSAVGEYITLMLRTWVPSRTMSRLAFPS